MFPVSAYNAGYGDGKGRNLARRAARTFSVGLSSAVGLSIVHERDASAASAMASMQSVVLCANAKTALAKDADLREAQMAVSGSTVRFSPKGGQDVCISLAAVLKFDKAWVPITAVTDGDDAAPMQVAHLSAYFLRKSGRALRLVSEKHNFAGSNDNWGARGRYQGGEFRHGRRHVCTGWDNRLRLYGDQCLFLRVPARWHRCARLRAAVLGQ
jgi:hypothetical protein